MSHDPLLKLKIAAELPEAIYRQIGRQIAESVEAGQLPAGHRLPSGSTLAAQLGVNALTVHRAYQWLTQQGLVQRRHGSGTYVLPVAADRDGQGSAPGVDGSSSTPSVRATRLKQIVIVVGEDHLGQCSRDMMRLVTEMLQGIDDVLGDQAVPVRYARTFTHDELGHLQAGTAVLIKKTDEVDASLLPWLEGRGVPVVGVLNSSVALPIAQIGFDVHRAVAMSCQHLVDCGYRRIGYIGCMGGKIDVGAKFLEFTNVLYRAGLDFQIRHVRDVPNQLGCSYGAACEIIRKGDLPEAFFVETDYRAMEVVAALRDHGLRVPEDVGVASMDDAADAGHFDPPLTTTRTPQREIGQEVASQLRRFFGDGQPLKSAQPRSTLMVRKSTLPMPTPAGV